MNRSILTVPVRKIEGDSSASFQDLLAVEDPLEIRLGEKTISITMRLGKVPDPGSAPSKALLDLLAANNRVWPSFFNYEPANNYLFLDMAFANRGLKAKELRARFESMCDHVRTYEPLWNPEKWPDARK